MSLDGFFIFFHVVLMFLGFFLSFQFVNRQFIPDNTYSGNEKEQGDEWSTETEVHH